MKLCVSCGYAMRKKTDYPLDDESRDYCKFCSRPDGSMQSWEEKLAGTEEILMRTKKMSREKARAMAARLLSAMPAWQGRG